MTKIPLPHIFSSFGDEFWRKSLPYFLFNTPYFFLIKFFLANELVLVSHFYFRKFENEEKTLPHISLNFNSTLFFNLFLFFFSKNFQRIFFFNSNIEQETFNTFGTYFHGVPQNNNFLHNTINTRVIQMYLWVRIREDKRMA